VLTAPWVGVGIPSQSTWGATGLLERTRQNAYSGEEPREDFLEEVLSHLMVSAN
jgi:hypothetical protein